MLTLVITALSFDDLIRAMVVRYMQMNHIYLPMLRYVCT